MKTNPALRLKCAAVALSLLAVSGFSALAATLTVTNTADSGPGSLRDAIGSTASGDTVNFAPALNGRTITLTSGELLITQALTIQGPGANQLTISGNQTSRVFHSVTDVTLAGLTITNGSAADFGGGVFHENGTLTVTKCVIFGNTATGVNSRGGGVYAGASIVMRDSSISQNSAANGSGIYNENEYYGGINNSVSMTISRCTIDHNTASVGGGGIYTKSYDTLIGNTTVAYNGAPLGGGVYIDIGGSSPGPAFLQCTVTGNSANPNSGGGIYIVVSANNFDAYFLENSIVAFQQSGGNIIGNNVFYNIDGSIFTDDPNLNLDPNGLQDNGGPTKTIALLSGSSAIDAGTPASGPSDVGIDGSTIKDQRGSARPVGGGPDIGAYEYNPTSCATVVTNTNDSGPGSLRCAIASAFTGDTITFAPNVGPQINLTSGELLIQKDLTIQGPGAKVLTVSGSSLSRVFRVQPGKVTISGLTIANGLTPSVVGPVVSGSGAGIFVTSVGSSTSSLTLSSCTVTNNQATVGNVVGVGITIGNASATIKNCTISNNHALQGVSSGSVGGGIGGNTPGGDVTIVNSTISGNSSYQGGGIGINNPSSGAGHLTITNSTISGNTAILSGGGLYFRTGSTVLGSTLIALNSAPTGPDIFTDPLVSGNPTVNSAGYNLVGTATGYTWINGAGDQLAIANPGLQLDANNLPLLKDNGGPTQTIALVAGSAAIDRGFADASLTTDQRGSGFARTIGVAADVGAFEVQQLPPVARAKNITVPAGSDCQASITPQQVDNGSAPGTPNDTVILSLDQSGPFAIGTHNVTLTATDSFGYRSSATAVVTVADTSAPVITPPAPSSATANSQGKAPVPNVLAQTTVSDCSTVTLQQSPAAGTLVGVGVQMITITATDSANNKSTATTTFTVKAALPSFTISINPSTVKLGGQVTVATTYNNPASTAQTVTLKMSLTTPRTTALILTVPLTLRANQSGSLSFPLPIAKSTPVGLYSVTMDVFLGMTQIGTSSAQLTVTK